MRVIIFQKELYACHWTTRKKNICTLSSHRATRELYAKVPSHRAPVGAVCEGSMRIELRSEHYAKGALCGSTGHASYSVIPSLFNANTFEPAHEIMVLFVLRKLILQTRMRSHPVGLESDF